MAEPIDNTAAGAELLGPLTIFGNKLLFGTVQSGARTASYDPADFYRIGPIAAEITQIAISPHIIGNPSEINRVGVCGEVERLQYLGPSSITYEARVGYARHSTALSTVVGQATALANGLNARANDATLNVDRIY